MLDNFLNIDDFVGNLARVGDEEQDLLPNLQPIPWVTGQTPTTVEDPEYAQEAAQQGVPVLRRDERDITEISADERAFVQHGVGDASAMRDAFSLDDLANRMLAKEGMEYEWGGTTKATGYDCSGIIYRIMVNQGFANYPRHSSAIYEHSKKISLKKALKTRGAILYTEGHIAVSLGNGKTIEAMGEDHGVVVGNAHGRFTHGGILPELAASDGRRNKRKQGRVRFVQTKTKSAPADLVSSVDPLTQIQMTFGGLEGEVRARARRPQEEDSEVLPELPKRARQIFANAANKYGLDPRLLMAVAAMESGTRDENGDPVMGTFNAKAGSSAGAQGAMQIMPSWGLENPYNLKANIFKGAEILAHYINKMGSLRGGLAAYNGGPGNPQYGYADTVLRVWRG